MTRFASLLLLAACTSTPQATSDAGVDAEVDAGPCGEQVVYEGKVDGLGSGFLQGARLTLRGDSTQQTMTDADGEFALCVPQPGAYGPAFVIDVELPSEWIQGQLVDMAASTGAVWAITPQQLADAVAQTGASVDPDLGAVIVYSPRDRLDVIEGMSAAPLTYGADGWALADDDESFKLFPNATPGTLVVKRRVDGRRRALPVEPGRITWGVMGPIALP